LGDHGGMDDAWGVGQPPAVVADLPLPPRLARLAALQPGQSLQVDPYEESFPSAAELPEVRTLIDEGWWPLHGAPLFGLLPAAWPVPLRAWVPDRLPRVYGGGTTDSYWGAIGRPPAGDDYDPYYDLDREAASAGLPAPPRGRIWLLRSPWPDLPMVAVLDAMWSITEDGPDVVADTYRAALDVQTWDAARVRSACSPEVRGVLDAWGARGRSGEAVARFVEWRLAPDAVDRLTAATGVDEPTALAWLTSLETDDLDAAAATITAWRAAGLPGDPPPAAHRWAGRDTVELRRWLEAGFDLYAASQLQRAGLETAIAWRAAGFDEVDTYELLRSDPDLTPAEARAFDGVAERREWIHWGFTAEQARDWAAAGRTVRAARAARRDSRRGARLRHDRRQPPRSLRQRADQRDPDRAGDHRDDARAHRPGYDTDPHESDDANRRHDPAPRRVKTGFSARRPASRRGRRRRGKARTQSPSGARRVPRARGSRARRPQQKGRRRGSLPPRSCPARRRAVRRA